MVYPRILVTGADGLIGQALARRLADWPGADVLLTGRGPTSRATDFAGGYTPLDVTDGAAVEALMQDFAPGVVLHLAAMSKVEPCERDKQTCWAVNVDATARLAAACHRHGARLVFLSTDFVFDGQAGPYAEDDRPAPINAYGRSKLAAENAIRSSRLREWAVVRTTLVYGHVAGEQRFNLVTFLARELAAGREIEVTTDQVRTPTYAPDLAEGILRVVRYRKSGVFHLAGREVLSTYAFAERVAERWGLDASLLRPVTTDALHPGAPRPLRAGLLILRAEAELGFRPRPLDVALDDLAPRLGLPAARPSP
ncbi:MAG: SDR family oxidoreductase [Rubricoccaceae bacterium]